MSKGAAQELMGVLRAGRSWTGEFLVRRKDGIEFKAHVQDLPVIDHRGALLGIIGRSGPEPIAEPPATLLSYVLLAFSPVRFDRCLPEG